jgi:RNA-directed DNA polymerase
MSRIQVETALGTKVSPRPTGLSLQDKLKNPVTKEKQMITTNVSAPSARRISWTLIQWDSVNYLVRRLQLRIAKAIKLGRYGRAKALQWLLTHSFYAKLLAVKRVTQNKGRNTPGIDRIIWRTPRQKMQAVKLLKRRGYRSLPLRRIYIPKKNGKLRPLGIPTMIDRGQQALHLLALEPIAETKGDKNSYGFRSKRSIHDAIEQCFIALARKHSPLWILEGDIKSCFDKISHKWLEENTIIDKRSLKQWLKAGYMEKNIFHRTEAGSPQGGIISPTLANIALDGLETILKDKAKRKDKINYLRYADDWICTANSREILEEKVLPTVINFLKERGLELSMEKTRISHIDDGFEFLGCNLRKYNGKLLIKPAKKGIKTFLNNIRKTIKFKQAATAEQLIHTLNPKIQGWTNHYRSCVAKRTFNQIDSSIFTAIWKWVKRKHPNKNSAWIRNKYFTRMGLRNWRFFSRKDNNTSILTLASNTSIKRHVKIKADATPYDPEYQEYFLKRERKQRCRTLIAGSN